MLPLHSYDLASRVLDCIYHGYDSGCIEMKLESAKFEQHAFHLLSYENVEGATQQHTFLLR